MSQLGEIKAENIKIADIEKNPFFFPDKKKILELEEYLTGIRKAGDSIGAKVTIIGKNIPIGLGEPVFDKLDALLAQGMMSINAVKGVEIGAGFNVVSQKGSEARDEITPKGYGIKNQLWQQQTTMFQLLIEIKESSTQFLKSR